MARKNFEPINCHILYLNNSLLLNIDDNYLRSATILDADYNEIVNVIDISVEDCLTNLSTFLSTGVKEETPYLSGSTLYTNELDAFLLDGGSILLEEDNSKLKITKIFPDSTIDIKYVEFLEDYVDSQAIN